MGEHRSLTIGPLVFPVVAKMACQSSSNISRLEFQFQFVHLVT